MNRTALREPNHDTLDAAVVLSIEDFRTLSGAADSDLVDFFRESPLRGIPADLLIRSQDTGRNVEL